jgi:sensor c-di-GMP phosphodiesterase-like protein
MSGDAPAITRAVRRLKRATRRKLVFATVALALAVVPTALVLALTYWQAMAQAKARLGDVADATAERVRTVLWAAEGALVSVHHIALVEGCSGRLVAAFAAAAAPHDWLRALAFITAEGRLACSSYGAFDPPIPVRNHHIRLLGPESWAVRFSEPVNLSYLPGSSLLAVHRLERGRNEGAWLVAAIAPSELLAAVDASTLGAAGRIEIAIGDTTLAADGQGRAAADGLSERREIRPFDVSVQAGAGGDWALADWRQAAAIALAAGSVAAVVFAAAGLRLAGRRASLRDDLADALENGELAVHYQPVIDLQRNRCVGAEALIRWTQSSGTVVSPDVFIQLAEDTGDIVPMTRWLMRRVGEEMGERLRCDEHFHIAVNLAPVHFNDGRVSAAADAFEAAARSGFPLGRLQFEITERALVDEERCKAVIAALSSQGNRVLIDDFGTGYSSLAYVGNFRVDALKIDKAFVKTIGTGAASAGLADIIVDMAKTLGLKIVAEGVETEDQAAHLRRRGVQYAQGWLYSKPLPAADFLAFVDRFNAGTDAGLAAAS